LAVVQRLVPPDYYAQLAKASDLTINPKGPDSPFDPSELTRKSASIAAARFFATTKYCSRYIVGTRAKAKSTPAPIISAFACVKSTNQDLQSSAGRTKR